MVAGLCYKAEGRGFETWDYSASNKKLVPEHFSVGRKRQARKADNLTAICEPIV
jgi:hypothetical protein